ncbi:glutamate-5-semialdehyde dehydrogenase [Lutimonas zeaxanthinifaciens]|uniref:glutamate-5-semialdehyde dehydrogenase n=1 Tax=Lutimonas zeaxanthinifaciens TaxID=3060215 RepID=UPI00265CBC8B|nr:glutamate-5-semialdehyde dehydrogenase [Lutimonas sp. YSD2104]WKK67619.1 glutamate-5-semialdehyde dehydrogenase [Lutimonas sp. YSD2104]
MESILTAEQRNKVLLAMAELVRKKQKDILEANALDMSGFDQNDLAMYDRLKVDQGKIDGMILSLEQLAQQEDPLGVERFHFKHESGLHIYNKTASFGTVMIIYESRPDVTIEAGGIAFKSGNKILLKGGKEALNSNLAIVNLWHEALSQNGINKDWVTYLNYDRERTRAFLKQPDQKIDLIIPRGGERLIEFVKKHASCPVIVSGRGNNFVYVDKEADVEKALEIIVNAKTAKISACNALDKVLIHKGLSGHDGFVKELISKLKDFDVEIIGDNGLNEFEGVQAIGDESIWYQEFLDYKIVLADVNSPQEAVGMINKYGGGHSASIVTENKNEADFFLDAVDAAAVYHNASTRFTDGFQFGLGGELAISTDKLHQRGPIGLQHLVTNKWYVYGNGQIR